jgi:transposase-like protein
MSSDEPRGQPHATDDGKPAKESVRCPFCQSVDVELMSIFGSQLSTDQYYCHACHTPFERLSRD